MQRREKNRKSQRTAFCEAFGVRWQSAAATPLSHAREANDLLKAFARSKAAWRSASRRSPKYLPVDFTPHAFASLRLCVKK
jgi:hypothetical protein